MSMSRAAPADAVMHSAQRLLPRTGTGDDSRLREVTGLFSVHTRIPDRLNYSVSSREQLRVSEPEVSGDLVRTEVVRVVVACTMCSAISVPTRLL